MPDFSFETTITVRYQDYDMMGHVNNAVYATYLEEARSAYITEALAIPIDDIHTVLAHLELDFLAPLERTDEVTGAVTVTNVGRKSVTMTYELRDESKTCATAETVLVTLDPETDSPVALTEQWLDGIEAHEGTLPGRE